MASGGASPAAWASTTTDSRVLTPSNLNISSVPPKVKICVFCGASEGKSPAHMAAARSLATVMAEHNMSLVYGGGTCGLMGEIAKTLVSLSGPESVHGIIPSPLIKHERGNIENLPSSVDGNMDSLHPEYEIYGRTTIVKDMHTRKQMMAQEVLSGAEGSGFVALSGGYGTLEELMEVVTWNQLGIHNRGVVALNIEGYWDGLLAWCRGAVEKGFVKNGAGGIIVEARSGEEAVKALKEYQVSEGRLKLVWGNE